MAFKIYTRTGDGGETALYGGQRVPKDTARIEAYGTVDELNAQLGVLLASVATLSGRVPASRVLAQALTDTLVAVQGELFAVGAQLATPPPVDGASAKTPNVAAIGDAEVLALEAAIDALDEDLPALTSFILPAGPPATAHAHVCRTVARRAERRVVTLAHAAPVDDAVIRYLNRLSDYLFTAARALTYAAGAPETPWRPNA